MPGAATRTAPPMATATLAAPEGAAAVTLAAPSDAAAVALAAPPDAATGALAAQTGNANGAGIGCPLVRSRSFCKLFI